MPETNNAILPSKIANKYPAIKGAETLVPCHANKSTTTPLERCFLSNKEGQYAILVGLSNA